MDAATFDVEKASKGELRSAIKTAHADNQRLRDSVARMLRQPEPAHHSYPGREDDIVPAGWVERHGIAVPRADGIHESKEAWVRVKAGTIVGAGLKNQSILLLMISLKLLDSRAEHHGNLYRDWRAAFLSRLDPTKMGEPGGYTPAAWSKEDRYSKLIHRIEKDAITAMDSIVMERPKAKYLAAFQAHQETFRDVFLTVVDAMRDINREAEAAE